MSANGGVVHTHEDKEEHIFFFFCGDKEEHIYQHFSTHFGQLQQCSHTLNWELISLHSLHIPSLEEVFPEDEVHAVILDLANDKAPGPDGYISAFFKSVWEIIKPDLMQAVQLFYMQHEQHFKHLNAAHMVLIPKKNDASIGDYRPISLTHSVAKIFSKRLATRLAPHLNQLVSRTQSAFIKKRSIQDNFLFTQNLVRALHRAKQPAIFMKLDIAKAFDSVRWEYLLEVMRQMGFGSKWCGWVSILLSTATTAVLLNGACGPWFRHFRGLRQGDPLIPLLFILAMEPLQRLFELSIAEGTLTPIQHSAARVRMSMYADDVAIFLNPDKEEIRATNDILDVFGTVSGLITNKEKSMVYPIQCFGIDVQEILQCFQC